MGISLDVCILISGIGDWVKREHLNRCTFCLEECYCSGKFVRQNAGGWLMGKCVTLKPLFLGAVLFTLCNVVVSMVRALHIRGMVVRLVPLTDLTPTEQGDKVCSIKFLCPRLCPSFFKETWNWVFWTDVRAWFNCCFCSLYRLHIFSDLVQGEVSIVVHPELLVEGA